MKLWLAACLLLATPAHATYVYAPNYGATANDSTDDTDAIQRAINAVPLNGALVFPAGTFMVDTMKHLNLKSNMTLLMQPGTVLRAIPNGVTNYKLLSVHNASGVHIQGGYLWGDREQHLATAGEWGFGIAITGNSTGVSIAGTVVTRMWGDGIYIQDAASVLVKNVNLVWNRRNNLSVVAGHTMRIEGSRFAHAAGTNPQAGIDLEPDSIAQVVKDVEITGNSFTGNARYGVVLWGAHGPIAKPIRVHNNSFSAQVRPLHVEQCCKTATVTSTTIIWQ